MKFKNLILGIVLCLLFVFICSINTFAERIYQSTSTDGQNIYHVENDRIYKYDMKGNNKTEIYKGLSYGMEIEGLYDNYLYFNEYTEPVEGLGTACNLKVLNTNDNTSKIVTDMHSRVYKKGNKVYILFAERGDYSETNLYCADINGDNYKLITEKSNYNFIVIDNKLYYIELDYNDNCKHRVIRSNQDGTNSEVVIDWFVSDNAQLNEKGVIWYKGDGKLKDYNTKQDVAYNDNNRYGVFYSTDDPKFVYVSKSNSKSKKDSFVFYKSTEDGKKEEICTLKDVSNTICFINIVNGVLYYTIGDNIDVKSLVLEKNNITVILNGKEISFDQPPIKSKTTGRVLVPIRKIAEEMGDTVKWNQEIQTAFIQHGATGLIVPFNEYAMYMANNKTFKNWGKTELDEPAQNLSGRTLVPVRAFCESLNCAVDWDEKNKIVNITYDASKKGDELTETDIKNINASYYAFLNNNKVNPLRMYTFAIDDYIESRNLTIDTIGIAFSDWTKGTKDALKSKAREETVAQTYMRYAIAELMTKMSDDEPRKLAESVSKDVKKIKMETSTIMFISELSNISEKAAAEVLETPQLEKMKKVKEAMDVAGDLLTMTTEELDFLKSDFEQSTNYLTLLDKYTEDSDIKVSIDHIKKEYLNDYISLIYKSEDLGIDLLTDKAINGVTGSIEEFIAAKVSNGTPILLAVNFGHSVSKSITDIDGQVDAIYMLYSNSPINGTLDSAFTTARQSLLTTNNIDDVRDFRQIFEMDKQAKLISYNSINDILRNSSDKKIVAESIKEINDFDYMIWEDK